MEARRPASLPLSGHLAYACSYSSKASSYSSCLSFARAWRISFWASSTSGDSSIFWVTFNDSPTIIALSFLTLIASSCRSGQSKVAPWGAITSVLYRSMACRFFRFKITSRTKSHGTLSRARVSVPPTPWAITMFMPLISPNSLNTLCRSIL